MNEQQQRTATTCTLCDERLGPCATHARSAIDAANRFVPCEACGIEVPRFLATVEPQSGGHLCDACVLELTEAAKSGSGGAAAVSFNEMPTERDWVFARRAVVRQMIRQGNPGNADHLPGIAEVEAHAATLQWVVERIEAALNDDMGADARLILNEALMAVTPDLRHHVEGLKNGRSESRDG